MIYLNFVIYLHTTLSNLSNFPKQFTDKTLYNHTKEKHNKYCINNK